MRAVYDHNWLFPRREGKVRLVTKTERTGWMLLDSALSAVRVLYEARGRLATMLQAALMNAVVFIVLATGLIAIREGSFNAVYRTFLEPTGVAAERERADRAAATQAQLRQEIRSDGLVRGLLSGILIRHPEVSRVRVAIIHNGVVGLGDRHVWKFDVITGVAQPGHEIGPLVQNDPLSGWDHFLPDFLAGRCAGYPATAIINPAGRARLEQMGIAHVLTCPIRTPTGELLGAMFTMFDRAEDVPTEAKFDELQLDAQRTAAGLSLALLERRHD